MNDRELVAVFWATCAAVCLIWGIATLVRLGIDQQEKAERIDVEDLAYWAVQAPDMTSHTAPEAADSPSEADSPRANGVKPF